jgi:hypothetical protein
VLVWERGLGEADRIVDDLRSRFLVIEAARIHWTRACFARNLTRLYGQDLPPDSDKERESGTGPFLVLVVADPEPRHRRVRTSHGRIVVNTRMLDAKKRYRGWTGGGYRVHATLTPRETEKDLFLLLGRRTESVSTAVPWNGEVPELDTDLVGAGGWRNDVELLGAIESTVASVALDDGRAVLVDDRWWVTRIVDDGGPDSVRERHEPIVGGTRTRLDVFETGDGSLPEIWQRAILAEATRDERGLRIPSEQDRSYLELAKRGDPAARDSVEAYVASLPGGPLRGGLARWLPRRVIRAS